MSRRGSTTWCEAGIPSELRASFRWVCWRYAERGSGFTKMPVCARTGGAGSSTDPATWCDYATASAYARTHGYGIGYVLGDGTVGVDLDDCAITAMAGDLAWAREIVDDLSSYTELTPSGGGVHVLVHGTLPAGRRRTGKIEMYDRDRYFTVTGRHLPWTPGAIEERTGALAALHQRLFGAACIASAAQPATRAAMFFTSDSEILERAHRARNRERFARLWRGDTSGYGSASEADLALCSLLGWYTNDPEQIGRLVSRSGLARAKWERADYRERTIATALASTGARRGADAARAARTDALIVRELGL